MSRFDDDGDGFFDDGYDGGDEKSPSAIKD